MALYLYSQNMEKLAGAPLKISSVLVQFVIKGKIL